MFVPSPEAGRDGTRAISVEWVHVRRNVDAVRYRCSDIPADRGPPPRVARRPHFAHLPAPSQDTMMTSEASFAADVFSFPASVAT